MDEGRVAVAAWPRAAAGDESPAGGCCSQIPKHRVKSSPPEMGNAEEGGGRTCTKRRIPTPH